MAVGNVWYTLTGVYTRELEKISLSSLGTPLLKLIKQKFEAFVTLAYFKLSF
jgi:hypothetical protein